MATDGHGITSETYQPGDRILYRDENAFDDMCAPVSTREIRAVEVAADEGEELLVYSRDRRLFSGLTEVPGEKPHRLLKNMMRVVQVTKYTDGN